MNLLPETFEKKGFSHRLQYRAGNVAIYKRWKTPDRPHFETIIIREQKPRVITTPDGEIHLPHAELYPSSQQWGLYGWTYPDFESARSKAATLFV